MSLFNGAEKAVLDNLFGSNSPATYQLAVSSTLPAEDGTNITEPGGGVGYARVSITNNSTSFPAAPSGGPKTNGVAFQFTQATGSWGAAVGWWVLYDGATPIIWGTLTPSKTITSGDILRIPSGQMTISCD